MSQDSERLLESDRLEEVLEEPAPPQPVVVVEYRRRKRPWIPVLVVALVAVLGSFYELHRREVERLRLRAMVAQDELRNLKEESEARRLQPPAKAGLAGSSPGAAAAIGSGGSPAAGENKGASPSPAPPSSPAPTVAGPDRPGLAPAMPGKSEIAAGPDGPVAKADPATSTAPPARVEAAPAAASNGAEPPRHPNGIVVEPASSLPGPEDGSAIAVAAGDGSGNGAEDVGGDGAIKVADRGESPAPVPAPGEARPGAPDDRPLPSREETERQIREEARLKQAESRERFTRQREEVRDMRDEERQRFRDELKLILEEHGNEAGKWISDLSDRSGRDSNPVLHAMAIRVIGSRGTSQKAKVQRLRAIGVPEPVILDFLANEVHRNLGARNGPRSREDVWVQAGRLLLRYDWKPPGSPPAPAPGNKPAAAGPAAQPAAAGAAEPARAGR